MQICTAQHLISHLSVKVPSVGSPAGPSLMSWQVQDRNMDEEQKKLKEKREGGRSKQSPRYVESQKGGQLFKAHLIMDRKWQCTRGAC